MSAVDQQWLPNGPDEITPAFLNPILRDAGVLRQATVAAIDAQPLVAKASFNAKLAWLRLTYDIQESTAPQSLIAKLPTGNPELHENATVFRPGMKECWFYRHGVDRTPVNVPLCYYNAVDSTTGESFLLLEDLAPARPGDWVGGASVAQAELALTSLARLHAAWWATDSAAEPELARLRDNDDEAQDLVERLYAQGWPRFLERTTVEMPADVRQFGEHLVGRVAVAEALLDQAPWTLNHGDFRLDNMLFDTRQGEPVCWVIDWEDIMLWSGMNDVAWFLGGCLRVEESHREERLLRHYHKQLTRVAEDYSWEQCYHDYRRAMISGFVQGILSAADPKPGDEYEHDLSRAVAERFIAAVRRLRLFELLPF